MSSIILYFISGIFLIISWIKDKKKTKKALKKAWKSFENILPQFLTLLLIIGLMLSLINKETISRLLGSESGSLGMIIAAFIGSITLIPGFVAFPLAASLLQAGAGYGQIAMFVTTLMMVGIVTIPIERKYFGSVTTYKRNILAFIFSVIVAFIMGSAAAGPLYAAFPIAGVLLKKGVSLFNVFLFIGAWSATKIPMILFEASNLGLKFILIRFSCNLIGIVLIAYIISKSTKGKVYEEIYSNIENI